MSVCLSVFLSVCLSVCLSIYSPVYLQAWKLSNSARLPHFSTLTTSKAKQVYKPSAVFELDNIQNEAILQFCAASSIFELDNIKSKAILRDFLQKWKVKCSADSLVPMRFAIFPLHLSKVLRLSRKSDARSYEVLHLSRKIILANLQIWCSKVQPLSGNQRPDLLTSLMNMSFVLRLPQKMHLCRSSSNVPRLPWFLEMPRNLHILLTFDKVHSPLRLPRETTSEPPKVARARGALYIFDFEACFAPQRRALFRRRNFQKWSECEVLLAFSLTNVLRATTACTFSSLIWPILARWLRTRRFSEPTFSTLQSHKSLEKPCFATFLPFRAPASSFFWDFLFLLLCSSLTLPISAFHLSILSEVWLLNFLWSFVYTVHAPKWNDKYWKWTASAQQSWRPASWKACQYNPVSPKDEFNAAVRVKDLND